MFCKNDELDEGFSESSGRPEFSSLDDENLRNLILRLMASTPTGLANFVADTIFSYAIQTPVDDVTDNRLLITKDLETLSIVPECKFLRYCWEDRGK